jgi:membrane protease YdiL (CAAX protease family)
MNQNNSIAKILISFIILFFFYHLAEYFILFRSSPAGFFSFQLMFFIAAYSLGYWNDKTGLPFWGLKLSGKVVKYFLIGLTLGIILYAVPFLLSLAFGIESIINVPHFNDLIKTSLPFISGVILSSFSEDILTRGLVFRLFSGSLRKIWIILISSTVFLLNHIYRLSDGFDTLLYIFLLGFLLIIPLLYTKNLWITGFMHWAGNSFFFVTHNAILTESNPELIKPNILFSFCLVIFIPIVWLIFKKTERI